jgi:phosphatidylinositol glycan class B
MTAAWRDTDRVWLAILGLALALRVAASFWPSLHHPDELWQYLETTRHVRGDPWVQTWEAEAGIRSWLLPLIFAGPMALGDAIAPGSQLGVVFARLVCVAVALGGVVAIGALGARVSRAHGIVALFAAAIWFELVYYGARTLSEPIATAALLGAAALGARGGRRDIIWAGLLLGLGVAVRFHFGPAAFVLALGIARLDLRHWGRLIAGGFAALLVSGLSELAMGATPLAWIYHNLHHNLLEGRAASFGVSPAWWYLQALWELWGFALPPLVGLAVLGGRRYPVLLAAALVNLAVHSGIGHKELRFILLTDALILALAAIGSVDLVRRWTTAPRAVAVLGAGWLALSIACGALGSAAAQWGALGRLISVWRTAGAEPGGCGVAVVRSPGGITASHVLLGRDWPIYEYDASTADAARRSRAFNVVIAAPGSGRDLQGFQLIQCTGSGHGDYCVWRRPAGCTQAEDDRKHTANAFLRRHNR